MVSNEVVQMTSKKKDINGKNSVYKWKKSEKVLLNIYIEKRQKNIL